MSWNNSFVTSAQGQWQHMKGKKASAANKHFSLTIKGICLAAEASNKALVRSSRISAIGVDEALEAKPSLLRAAVLMIEAASPNIALQLFCSKAKLMKSVRKAKSERRKDSSGSSWPFLYSNKKSRAVLREATKPNEGGFKSMFPIDSRKIFPKLLRVLGDNEPLESHSSKPRPIKVAPETDRAEKIG